MSRTLWIGIVLAGLIALPACDDGGSCNVDSDCDSGEVCARTMECLAPDEVRTVRLTWTVDGEPASATTCATTPNLVVRFQDDTYETKYDDTTGYLPVPCATGLFPIDKLPTRYTTAVLGIDPESGDAQTDFDCPADPKTDTIADDGTAAFDLTY